MTIPMEYMCPITNDVMRDPVIDSEGHTYERAAIVQWLQTNPRSPITRKPMTVQDLKPNRALAEAIRRQGRPSPPPPPPHTPYYNAMTGPVYVCPNEYPYQVLVDVAPTVVQTRPPTSNTQLMQQSTLQQSTPQGRTLRVLLALAIAIILLVFLFRAL